MLLFQPEAVYRMRDVWETQAQNTLDDLKCGSQSYTSIKVRWGAVINGKGLKLKSLGDHEMEYSLIIQRTPEIAG